MHGFVGEKIGEGATADIHVWAQGQVVKLFKFGFSQEAGSHEARMTRVAFGAGAPAPEVFDEVNVDGRFGIILTRFDGPTLHKLLVTRAITHAEAGTTLATLYRSVHALPIPPGIFPLRDWFKAMARRSGGRIPQQIAEGVLGLIERLPPENKLCHNDLHPGNIMMTSDGPRIIDWLGAVRAGVALDLGRFHLTHHEIIHDLKGIEPWRPRALNAAVQSEYARLVDIEPAALSAAIEAHMPILRAIALAERVTLPDKRESLIRSVEAALWSAN